MTTVSDQALAPEVLVPENETERIESARAIVEERRLVEGDALVDGLTPRERWLIGEAWAAGINEERGRVEKALRNPHAVTLDADQVRETINAITRAPQADLSPWERQGGFHYDQRVVRLLRLWEKIASSREGGAA